MQYFTIIPFIVIVLIMPYLAIAQDKNGVSPNTISLPTGPGSIEGLGDSFQPMQSTGMASYEMNLILPRGVNDHTPVLKLRYNSGKGYGVTGMGWRIGSGSIRRQTEKGIPRYVDEKNLIDDDHDGQIDEYDELDRYVGPDDEELIQIDPHTYRARIENNFIKYQKIDDYWIAHLTNGSYLIYGRSQLARIKDQSGNRIFEWLFEQKTDVHGNVIQYIYTDFNAECSQKYLQQIQYGSGNPPWSLFYFAFFTYESRLDQRKNYKSGFLIRTTRRLKQINIGVEGLSPQHIEISKLQVGDWNQNKSPDALIRQYKLDYDIKSPHLSLLSAVTQIAADAKNYLPPVKFSYGLCIPDNVISAKEAIIGSINEPFAVMDNPSVEIVDLNADSLPDILNTTSDGVHVAYINSGGKEKTDGRMIVWNGPQEILGKDLYSVHHNLKDDRLHLADMNGDGISDLVYTDPFGSVMYYLNTGVLSWNQQQQMSIQHTSPPGPFNNPNVKSTDCNFDKRMDVIKSSENAYYTWFNTDRGIYSKPVITQGAVYQDHPFLFSEFGVHLSDMNGDRMNDVVKIKATQVIYCANMGHGNFDEAVIMPITDQTLTDEQIKKAKLEDINGDGISDLVIEDAEFNSLWYWLNYGTDSFDYKRIIKDMPDNYSSTMVTRWADINGNGTTDLIYADSSYTPRLRIIDIGELIGKTTHTNLLTEINNGRGALTTIVYQNSTWFYIQAKSEHNPWQTSIPFPVSVVSSVKIATGLDLDNNPGNDIYVKDYIYRDAYYDDHEKTFRGFGQVKVIEHGDTSFPTLHSIHYFHTGGPDQVDNDKDDEIDEVSQVLYREEDALKGVLLKTVFTSESGQIFSSEINTWELKTLVKGIDDIEIRFARNTANQTLIYDNTTSPESILITKLYDDYGNICEQKNYGALSIEGDEIFTYKEFINNVEKWIIGKLIKEYKTNASGQKESESKYYYDGDPYIGLSFGEIEKGNISRVEAWIKDDRYLNLKQHAFDSYGNITGIKDPNGNLRTITYDTLFHTYPEVEIIHFNDPSKNLHLSVNYHPGFGLITRSEDFNGNTTYYQYDSFGRIVQLIKPGDSIENPTQRFIYKLADPHDFKLYVYDEKGNLTISSHIITANSITTKQLEKSGASETFDSILYMDGMDRKLSEIFEWSNGFIVKNAIRFNQRGTIRYEYLPYHTTTSEFHVHDLSMQSKKEFHYDSTGREVLTIYPPDKNENIYQSVNQYFPLKIIAIDQNKHKKEYINDAIALR